MVSMLNHSCRRVALHASFASTLLLFAPAAWAQEVAETSKESLTPAYPIERPASAKQTETSTKATWYGPEIIGTGVAFDVLGIVGVPVMFSGSVPLGGGLIITSLVGRSLSGPIIHITHGHWLRALASFGLESSGVLAGIGVASLVVRQCPHLVGADVGPTCSNGAAFAPLIGIPLAVSITGNVIDAMFLAHEKPAAAAKTARFPFSLSPYALPSFQRDERNGTQRISVQMGLAGQF